MAKTFSKRTKVKTAFNALIYGMEVPIGRYVYVLRNRILFKKEKQDDNFHPVLTVDIEDFLDLFLNISNINTGLLRKKYKTHDFKKLSEKDVLEYED